MYLAGALAKLDDIDNASAAYERAIELEDDMVFRLNYGEHNLSVLLMLHQLAVLCITVLFAAAISLSKFGDAEAARIQFDKFQAMFAGMAKEVQAADPDIVQQRRFMLETLQRP